MRKTSLLGATFLALAVVASPLASFAQTPAPTPAAPAAAAPSAPAPAPETAPSTPPADVTPGAPSADTGTSPAKPAKKTHAHRKSTKAHGGKLVATKAGDKAVEDLNDQSLNSAKTGKPFTPPPTPEAAKQDAHAPAKKMAHHTSKAKKTAAKASSDATPPADSSTPPADSSGK